MECPQCCYLPTQRTLQPTLYLYMNLELKFENRRSIDQRVIALHGRRRVAGLIPSRVPIDVAAFYATGLDLV